MSLTTAVISNTAYVNMPNLMTIYFSYPQSNPFLGSCSNGTVFNISTNTNTNTGLSSFFSFYWTPFSLIATSFSFNNIYNFSSNSFSTITSSNTITPFYQTTASVSSSVPIFTNTSSSITVTFSNYQSIVPSLGSCSNGNVSNLSGSSGYIFTFYWTPITSSASSFIFINVSGAPGLSLTSVNSLIPLLSTTLISVTPTSVLINIAVTLTAVFSNNLSAIPTITPSNGTVSSQAYSSNNVTFTWTPTTAGSATIVFTNVTGSSGSLTSSTLTITSQSLSIVTPLASFGSLSSIHTAFTSLNGVSFLMVLLFMTLTTGLTTSTNWTFECWLKGVSSDYPSSGTTFSTVFGSTGAGTSISTSAGIVCSGGSIYGTALNYVLSGVTPLIEGDFNWHHIAITWNGTTASIYKDGYLNNSNTPGAHWVDYI